MRILKLFILLSIVLLGCKTEEPQNPPTVITKVASDVTLKNATLNGEVTNEGFSATSERGFVFSEKNTNPSVSDSKVQSGYGKGVYSIVLDKLPVNTKYYYKAYATNTKGTAYGEVQSFTTADYKLPTAVTDVPKNITYTTVELGGSVTDEGGGVVSESGFVVGINVSPTIADLKFPVTKGKSAIALIVSKLNVNTKYYVRSYAINEKGVAYGNEQSFITDDYKLPTVTTDKPVDITYNSAVLIGFVTSEGGLIVSQRGFCFGINPNPTIFDNKVISGEGLGSFKINLEQLKYNLKYYVRSYAINSKGIGYGNEQSFNTLELPVRPRVNTAIVEVKSKTGRIWMDRNLGATRAAISSKDTLAIGDLYQWGRLSDGHELRTSAIEESFYTNSTLSITDVPGNAIFIRNENKYWREDWRLTQNDNLWQGVNGINNPCPNGYRLPTIIEWKQETETWSGYTSPFYFTSPLKLPIGGYRQNDGRVNGVMGINNNDSGNYWSSTVGGINAQYYSTSGGLSSGGLSYLPRAFGLSVRCIKD